MNKNNIRIGFISPRLVHSSVPEAIITNVPHIQTSDVSDTVVQMLSVKPHVQIHDIIVRNVKETYFEEVLSHFPA